MSLTEEVNLREEQKFNMTNNETDAQVVTVLLSAVKEIVAEATTDFTKNDENRNSEEKTTIETNKQTKDEKKEEEAIKKFNDAVKENQELTKILTEMLEKPVEVKAQEEDEIPKEKHEEKAIEMLVSTVSAPDIAHDQIEQKEIDETEKASELVVKAASTAPISDIIHDHVEKTEKGEAPLHETDEATEVLLKAATATTFVSDIIHDHVEKTEMGEATIHETEKTLLTAVVDITHDHKQKTEADDSLKEEKLVQKTNDLDIKKIVEEHETYSIETNTVELQELSKGRRKFKRFFSLTFNDKQESK
jgi:hypothetical protein